MYFQKTLKVCDKPGVFDKMGSTVTFSIYKRSLMTLSVSKTVSVLAPITELLLLLQHKSKKKMLPLHVPHAFWAGN